jgi:sulfotransferase family protein
MSRLSYGWRAALGLNPAGRRLTVLPDDIFIVSYPRSGNTWTRFLIGNLLSPNSPVTFANVESRIPEIYLCTDQQLRQLAKPRIMKSHEYFDPRYKRIIYLVRDPRDVAVSLYHYSLKRQNIPDGYPLDEFVPRFIAGEFFVGCGTWEEHVLSWLAPRRRSNSFLFFRYEDLLANPVEALAKVASGLQLATTRETLTRAVELSTAARMRDSEKKHSANWKLTKDTRQDIPFVREAKSGGWQGKLSPAGVEQIERAWRPTMQELGYPVSTIP